jgi:hypothetical protein
MKTTTVYSRDFVRILREEILKELKVSEDEILDFLEDVGKKLGTFDGYDKISNDVQKAVNLIDQGQYEQALKSLITVAKTNQEVLVHVYPVIAFLKDKEEGDYSFIKEGWFEDDDGQDTGDHYNDTADYDDYNQETSSIPPEFIWNISKDALKVKWYDGWREYKAPFFDESGLTSSGVAIQNLAKNISRRFEKAHDDPRVNKSIVNGFLEVARYLQDK